MNKNATSINQQADIAMLHNMKLYDLYSVLSVVQLVVDRLRSPAVFGLTPLLYSQVTRCV